MSYLRKSLEIAPISKAENPNESIYIYMYVNMSIILCIIFKANICYFCFDFKWTVYVGKSDNRWGFVIFSNIHIFSKVGVNIYLSIFKYIFKKGSSLKFYRSYPISWDLFKMTMKYSFLFIARYPLRVNESEIIEIF